MRLRRRTLLLILIALAVYLGGYGLFRATRTLPGDDGRTYVNFPDNLPGRAMFYLWRPLSLIDGAITGDKARIARPLMRIHGPRVQT